MLPNIVCCVFQGVIRKSMPASAAFVCKIIQIYMFKKKKNPAKLSFGKDGISGGKKKKKEKSQN